MKPRTDWPWRHRLKVVVVAGLAMTMTGVACAAPLLAIDYAKSRNLDAWLQDSVLGGPSFDAFERMPGNPIHRGEPPYEWPVNGFLFRDPVSRDWFAYIGEYTAGYIMTSSRATAFRSSDEGRTWRRLGPVIEPDARMFEKSGHTPDLSVVYDQGRYHMIYDWGELDFNKEGGIGYAWADRPEGPWTRAPQPITRNSELPLIEGRYRRTYAATLVKRKNDWLVTGMMDDSPQSWTLFTMTAPRPEGPYSQRKLVRNVRSAYFYPPLLEYFPSFVHDGYVYAPATSVARNRNMGVMFRAPLERATEESAWEATQVGSLWHSANVPHEYEGLWGQTFAGQVDDRGRLIALFFSRDSQNRGTVGVAHRQWRKPMRKNGFVVSAHGGPSLALLRRAYDAFDLKTAFKLDGTARILWDYAGVLGPNLPQADAEIAAESNRCHTALEIGPSNWRLITTDSGGTASEIATGPLAATARRTLRLQRDATGAVALTFGGRPAWRGSMPTRSAACGFGPAPVGIWLDPRSHLTVDRFRMYGKVHTARVMHSATTALLGSGESIHDWTEVPGALPSFKSTRADAVAKWNVYGRTFTLWSPRGPDLGVVEIVIDGRSSAKLDLRSDLPEPSQPIWVSKRHAPGHHAVILRSAGGAFIVHKLQVDD